MTGMFAVGVVIKFGFGFQSLVYFLFIATLIVITFIDLDYQIIPDIISIPGIFIFFGGALVIGTIGVGESILGIILGGGLLLAIAWIYKIIAKREGMGGGDVKLLAMIGALIGWKGVLVTVFISSVVGTLAGFLVMLHTRKNIKLAIPYGPFLAIGAICYLFFGDIIINWYFYGVWTG
jgi:leader peptidase (prepilin peptidase)/N-methyltransferase